MNSDCISYIMIPLLDEYSKRSDTTTNILVFVIHLAKLWFFFIKASPFIITKKNYHLVKPPNVFLIIGYQDSEFNVVPFFLKYWLVSMCVFNILVITKMVITSDSNLSVLLSMVVFLSWRHLFDLHKGRSKLFKNLDHILCLTILRF